MLRHGFSKTEVLQFYPAGEIRVFSVDYGVLLQRY